ncbi:MULTISPECIES: caspase family protein [unclassified Acidovorax]|uniref:caspase family protein n=1 Tax=unclassified Acidovorax TaxID=2684926 RepID=UPI001C49478A|nr:caspase family protein [Acidovorax sp. sif0632]MBV7464503.1 caspase family protein [Acidovorax sp. sif0613]
MKLAIVIGITDYQNLDRLPACTNDARAFYNFLNQTISFEEICFVSPSSTGREAKKIISEFVDKYKSSNISELIFYFSGHGARFEEDFFYTFVDYKSEKREAGGLRNSELDGLIKTLSPEITVKIVDACNSGTTYIKDEESDVQKVYEKSAQDHQLKRLYFMHSSAADAKSWAGPEFSHFTLAILNSLLDKQGPVRYRDVVADVADAMPLIGAPTPTFVIQAHNTEVFVQMDSDLVDYLARQIKQDTPDSSSSKDQNETPSASGALPSHSPKVQTVLQLAEKLAEDIYCTEIEAKDNLQVLGDLLNSGKWPKALSELFTIDVRPLEVENVPNRSAIGRWIQEVKDDDIFAQPLYEDEAYSVEEYREIPRKPSTYGLMHDSMRIKQFFGEKEYKLEKVNKFRKVIAGFTYSVVPIFLPHQIWLRPRSASLETYVITVVFLYSRRSLNGFYAIEHLKMTGWDTTKQPVAQKFKHVSAPLKKKAQVATLINSVMEDVQQFVIGDVRARLGS